MLTKPPASTEDSTRTEVIPHSEGCAPAQRFVFWPPSLAVQQEFVDGTALDLGRRDGNGHKVMLEKNNLDVAALVSDWVIRNTRGRAPGS